MKKWYIGVSAALLAAILAVVCVLGFLMISLSAIAGGGTKAGNGSCSTELTTEPVTGGMTLKVTVSGSETILSDIQLGNARRIIAEASQMGISPKGITIALITALQKSKLKNLANTTNVPESATYPHDGDGQDHDSVNIFQQRGNWGSVSQRMDISYSIKAFFGGPAGPTKGTPRGLLDIPGWEELPFGTAAQKVQVSAFPDAYDKWVPAAETILNVLGSGIGQCSTETGVSADGWVNPLAGPITSTFGRRDIICQAGVCSQDDHGAVDISAPQGTPIKAAGAGTVTFNGVGWAGAYTVKIDHGNGIETQYLHNVGPGPVAVGQTVQAGDVIASVGSTGLSTGPHLHFAVKSGGILIDPQPFMRERGVELGTG